MIDHPTLAQLWSAAHVCDPCGRAWGRPLSAPERMSRHEATCHLCGTVGSVAHVRWYGYLRRGLAIVEGMQTRETTTTEEP
jgi:hypothetical protein